MYYVQKRIEIAGSHHLALDYPSKCANLHGHNWVIVIYAKSRTLDRNGMVVDFAKIKARITDKLDHKNLNDVFDFNPTAENIAKWICGEIENCYKVSVTESENNTAIYEKDED